MNTDEDNMTLQQMPDSCAMEDNIDDGADLLEVAAPTSGTAVEKVPVSVEVCIRKGSTAQSHEVRIAVERLLGKRIGSLTYVDGPVPLTEGEDEFLDKHVEQVSFTDIDDRQQVLLFWQVRLQIHAYQLHEEGAEEEMDDDEELAIFHEWQLPSRDFAGLWESLVFDISIKHRLLRYSSSALLFAEHNVDPTLVAWNRVVLLFGPPGTGKTSLCKALAQKLAIIFHDRYKRSQLVEVNAHSLFSKWFSESGKLVSKLFTKIHELLDEEDSLLFILIDEVESLTAARQAALQGSEPSDSIRVVNALLTQLDALRARPNVMILTTSNITQAIDLAFVDRADIKAYIGPPSLAARYEILRSSVQELQRSGIITSDAATLVPYKQAASEQGLEPMSYQLLVAARGCENFSGRALRKLPFLAHASLRGGGGCCSLSKFLQALGVAVTTEREDRDCMAEHENQARCQK